MWRVLLAMAGAFWALTAPVSAMDLSFDGYADARVIVPAGSEKSWLDGGQGKLRFGAKQPSPDVRLVEAVGQATLAVTDELHAVAVLRAEPEQRTAVDVLESYLSWRPAGAGDWRWSAKAGAFFPSISVENDDLGWTSPYTLTPSAINSWIGEELRTIGGEGQLARRTDLGTVTLIGALFCCNEPAGALIADRGWALDDRPTALFERIRYPDATIRLFGETPPDRIGEFNDIDGHVGWYGGARVEAAGLGQVTLIHYENRADPFAASAGDAAWATKFWSLSLKTRAFDTAILAQALTGDTAVGGGGRLFATDFQSAFLLLSHDVGEDWRVSLRGEAFAVRHGGGTILNEDGDAVTAAAIWNARDWLRLTAELIHLDSRRFERVLEHEPIQQSDTQFQLGARVFF